MKLACDICGGELQMLSGGQAAVCATCGMNYPIERLREKLGVAPVVNPVVNDTPPVYDPENDPNWIPELDPSYNEPVIHYLHIKRKVDLFLCKAAVLIDGEQVAILEGQGQVTSIPVEEGVHTVMIRVASAAGITDLDPVQFVMGKHDWYGEFYLHRGAFKAAYKYKMWKGL